MKLAIDGADDKRDGEYADVVAVWWVTYIPETQEYRLARARSQTTSPAALTSAAITLTASCHAEFPQHVQLAGAAAASRVQRREPRS